MRLCPDNTGRFPSRPYYDKDELDRLCEQTIEAFMQERYDGLILPVPTDALTKLIERDAQDLDTYADLATAGTGVDGLTRFYPGRKPKVRVSKELSVHRRHEHRLRTTLSHEYGHIMLHRGLYEGKVHAPEMLEDLARRTSPVCKRDNMVDSPGRDWMEWQAGHCCGALLMPISRLNRVVSEYFERHGVYAGSVRQNTPLAGELLYTISKNFFVSRAAARVRLDRLGYLADHDASPSLFDA